jgi:hypothetical protein
VLFVVSSSGFRKAAFFLALAAGSGCTGGTPHGGSAAPQSPPAPALGAAPTEAGAQSTPEVASAPAAESSPPPLEVSPTPSPGPATEQAAPLPEQALPPPVGTKVLHVGDSFAGALGIPLGKLLEDAGVKSILKHKDSSYLTTWAWEPDLEQEIWRYNPDLVVVTLGANELGIADPGQREKTVKKIVDTIGQRPCLWVAIPLWSERHNGLLEVIEKSAAPCVYYDTNREFDTAHMARIHDGIHPTNEARRQWAEAVFGYLLSHRQPRAGAPWWLEGDRQEP